MAFLDGIITKGILPQAEVAELKIQKTKLEKHVSKILDAPVKVNALAEFPSSKRRAYEEIFGLIYECSASQANAKLLVDKMLARLK